MWLALLGSPGEQRASHTNSHAISLTCPRPRTPGRGAIPASPRGPRVAISQSPLREALADEGFERAEVALGQVLEAAAAGGHGGLGGVEAGHRAQQMLVVLG